MSRQRLATVVVATLATATIALPAFAHASFDKAQVPADATVDLTFRAPQERASTNVSIEALAPRQFTILECTAPAEWSCDVDEDSASPDTVITWTAGAGALLPETNFAFRVRTPGEDQQGVYAWPVIQTYADGHEAAWIGEAAPTIQVGDSDAPVVDNDEPAQEHGGGEEAPASEPAPASSPSPSTRPSSQPDADDEESTDADVSGESTADASDADSSADSAETSSTTSSNEPGTTADVDESSNGLSLAPAAQSDSTPVDEGRPVGLIIAVLVLALGGAAAFALRGRLGN